MIPESSSLLEITLLSALPKCLQLSDHVQCDLSKKKRLQHLEHLQFHLVRLTVALRSFFAKDTVCRTGHEAKGGRVSRHCREDFLQQRKFSQNSPRSRSDSKEIPFLYVTITTTRNPPDFSECCRFLFRPRNSLIFDEKQLPAELHHQHLACLISSK